MGIALALVIVLAINLADGMRINHNREVEAQQRAAHQHEIAECWNNGGTDCK